MNHIKHFNSEITIEKNSLKNNAQIKNSKC